MEDSARPACSLYVHVPFCRSRCTYCDFHSSVLPGVRTGMASVCRATGTRGVVPWLQSLGRHLSALKQDPGWKPYTTIYIGGGTPTVLPAGVLGNLLQLLAGSWAGPGTGIDSGIEASQDTVRGTEWTIEGNPDDLDSIMLASVEAAGVSRLSLGVQSLEDPVRKAVRRRGRTAEILSALENLANLWKHPWSADFMYGLPFQTPSGLAQDIKRIIGMGAGHVSLYQLALEDGTPLATEVRRGIISLPDPDLSADQYAAAAEMLLSAGYRRYEVSNWALPGQTCLHNQHYWRMDDWDAIGPSAVSNRRSGASYIRGHNSIDDESYVTDPLGSVDFSVVRGSDAMFEFLMMALRTSEGFSIQRFQDIFGHDPVTVFGDLPAAFPDLLGRDPGCWRPSDQGLDFLNRVLVAALEAAELQQLLPDEAVASLVKDTGTGGFPS